MLFLLWKLISCLLRDYLHLQMNTWISPFDLNGSVSFSSWAGGDQSRATRRVNIGLAFIRWHDDEHETSPVSAGCKTSHTEAPNRPRKLDAIMSKVFWWNKRVTSLSVVKWGHAVVTDKSLLVSTLTQHFPKLQLHIKSILVNWWNMSWLLLWSSYRKYSAFVSELCTCKRFVGSKETRRSSPSEITPQGGNSSSHCGCCLQTHGQQHQIRSQKTASGQLLPNSFINTTTAANTHNVFPECVRTHPVCTCVEQPAMLLSCLLLLLWSVSADLW